MVSPLEIVRTGLRCLGGKNPGHIAYSANMISQAGDLRRGGRFLLGALALSILLHALLAVLASWLWLANVPLTVKPPHETVMATTALRIERRPVPQPAHNPAPRSVLPIAPRVVRASAPIMPLHPTSKRELARQVANAPAQPSAPPTEEPTAPPSAVVTQDTLERRLAAQQQQFAREIARLHAQNNPLSDAEKSARPPASFHRSYFDVAGHRDDEDVQFYLTPVRRWYAGSSICYYTRYTAQYRNGGSEEGTIPWPICYPIGDDRIANPPYVHQVPAPTPPPGYVLPAGTYLGPLLAEIYRAGRSTQY